MRSTQPDKRVSVRPYREALEGVHTQFELIRVGLHYIPKKRMAEFFKSRAEQEVQVSEEFVKKLQESVPSESLDKVKATGIFEHILSEAKKDVRKKYRRGDYRVRLEVSEDRLNQSELLLLVAHFESFMKLVHAALLNAAPARVFGAKDTKILLREIFDSDYQLLSTSKFFKELIIREVKFLDRENIERKAAYFKENFEIVFGSEDEIDELKKIMLFRNRISHEIYSPPPNTLEEIKELPLVSDPMLERARVLLSRIPVLCVAEGAKRYPHYFR